MSIEVVSADVGKVYYISFGYGALMCYNSFTNFQVLEMFTEGMNDFFRLFSFRLVNIGYLHYGCRVRLYCGTLHIMEYTTHTTHFFSASCSAWSAMHKVGQGRAVTCAFCCTT